METRNQIPDLKSIQLSKQLQGNLKTAEWVQFLKTASTADKSGDKLRYAFGCSCPIVFILGILISIIMESIFPFLLLMVISVVLLILFFIKRKVDLPPILHHFIFPLAVMMNEEAKKDSNMLLRVDMRGGLHPQKMVGERVFSNQYPKLTMKYFTDQWLNVSLRLADGAKLTYRIISFTRQAEKVKRTVRGKIKHKTKYKNKALVDVRLLAPSDRYTLIASQPAPGQDQIQYKPRAGGNIIRVRRIILSEEAGYGVSLQQLLEVIGQAYRQLQVINPTGGNV